MNSVTTPLRSRDILAAALSLACLLSASLVMAKPEPPNPPLPEMAPVLWQESFDAGYKYCATNEEVVFGSYQFRESWSGYALERSGLVAPFSVPALLSAGHTNIMTATDGALRFWVRPSWSSVLLAKAGTEPGSYARLAELSVDGIAASVWSLQVLPDGSALSLVAQGESGPVELLNAPIEWRAGVSHLVALNFGPQGTSLFIDGQLVAEGEGTLAVPPSLSSLALGSTFAGAEAFHGDLEEVFSFARPVAEEEVAFYYSAIRKSVVSWQLGVSSGRGSLLNRQGLTVDAATLDAMMASAQPPAPPGGDSPPQPPLPSIPPVYSLGLGLTMFPPILTSSNSLVLVITNTPNSGWLTNSYDLFYTTNMAPLPNWAWLGRSVPGQTNFIVSPLPQPQCYFRLGTMYDSNGDGVPDAYTQLVGLADVSDQDGDGVSNVEEMREGRNPMVTGAIGDVSGVARLDVFTVLR